MLQNKNTPNLLSWSRICITPLIITFLVFDNRFSAYASCVLIIIAGVTDMLDGLLARKYASVSVIGKFLDPLADKLLVVSVLIMLVYLDRAFEYAPLFPLMVVIITGREIFITGLRAIAMDKGIVIAAGRVGKLKTWFQMVAIGALVLPGDAFNYKAHIFGLVILFIALLLTLISAIKYTTEFMRAIRGQTSL